MMLRKTIFTLAFLASSVALLAGCSSLQDLWGTRGSPSDVVPSMTPNDMHSMENYQDQQETVWHARDIDTGNNHKPYNGPSAHTLQANHPQQNTSHSGQTPSFGAYDQQNDHDVSAFEQNVLSRNKKKLKKQLEAYRVQVSTKTMPKAVKPNKPSVELPPKPKYSPPQTNTMPSPRADNKMPKVNPKMKKPEQGGLQKMKEMQPKTTEI